ncbi:MAG TPA: hypothetical protein PKV98_07850 [Burkholderiaceae bacterium]|nr:hypothetical protein [Burkholderiaceae bacterium]
MSDTQTEAKAAKAATVYEDVTMTDGRVVKFPGKRNSDKTVLEDAEGVATGVRFDFRNGQTRTLLISELDTKTQLRALAHGVSQKAGDEYSGVTEIEDMVLAVDEIFGRLRAGDWAVAREAGDSTAGASIVIKAIMEATGKPIDFVKDFLQKKLDAAKAKGEKLSRQELYNAFRNPATPTGKIIKRLEEEKLAKATKVSGADLLAEMG